MGMTIHYLLHNSNYLDEMRTLLDNLQSSYWRKELLLFGVSSNNDASNTCILNATTQYILATKRFDVRLTYS